MLYLTKKKDFDKFKKIIKTHDTFKDLKCIPGWVYFTDIDIQCTKKEYDDRVIKRTSSGTLKSVDRYYGTIHLSDLTKEFKDILIVNDINEILFFKDEFNEEYIKTE